MNSAVLNLPMAERIKPLTPPERAEARRLKAQFTANKARLGLTQEKLGELMGTTQGAISHWLNGRARISDVTLLRFAHYLEFDPEDVRPGIIGRMPYVNDPIGVSDRALRLAREFDDLPEQDQDLLISLLQRVRASTLPQD
jgi:transcriptional regulator with XRE-family HTH domain